MLKKLTSILLTFMILISMVTITAMAEELGNNSNVYSGSYSCKINNDTTDTYTMFTSAPIAVEPNTDYVMSVWSKGYGSPTAVILGSGIYKTIWPAGGNTWRYTATVFNTGDCTKVQFALANNPFANNGVKYIDDVCLAKASDPSKNLVTDPGFELGTGWTFKEGDTIFQKEYSSNVVPANVVSSITVSEPKTEYNLGDQFVEASVTATYGDGSPVSIDRAAFAGYDMNTPGKQTVTVICDIKTASYDITVSADGTIKYGDVSGDGVINNTDLTYYKNYIELGQSMSGSEAADLNLDGRINNTDIAILKNYIELNIPIVK